MYIQDNRDLDSAQRGYGISQQDNGNTVGGYQNDDSEPRNYSHRTQLVNTYKSDQQLPRNDANINQESSKRDEDEDGERVALIDGFREHLIRQSKFENDAISTRRPCKEEKSRSIKLEYKNKHKCDKDIFNPFKKDLNRFRDPAETKRCVLGGTSSEEMKYDYRRDHSDTMDTGKNTAKHAMCYKKTYLFLYNLMMFVMFLMVHLILTIKTLTRTVDDDSVQGAASIVKLLTYTQLLEYIHPILGLVPGGPWMPFLQVIGRLLVNHFLTDPEIRSNSAPYAHYLFIVWSSIEIFRYSFYALRVFNVEIYPITWCRYTLFMPLYPMGGFCEARIVMATVRHFEKTGAYTLSLPNSSNFSFSLPSFLRFYTLALLGPSIIYLMKYMWTQRCKQLKYKLA